MKGYFAITASILMLATTAFAKGWTAAPTGVGQNAVYTTLTHNGTDNGTDQTASSAILTSTTPTAGVVLTAGQRGGGMHGGLSGRANLGPGFNARGSFQNRSFDRDRFMHRDFDRDRFRHRDFDRDRFFHRDFDRDRFFPRHRFFDRDDFFFRGYGYYPYGNYYNPYYSYPYYYYPYGSYYYGNPYYSYPYPNSYFYFSW